MREEVKYQLLQDCVNYEERKAWLEFRKPESIDIFNFFVLEAIRTKNLELFNDLERINR